MNVILVGMNHKTAPLEIRERLSFACGDGVRPLEEILSAPAVREALYLSTCNRVEVLARAEDMEEAIARVKAFILRHGNLGAAELEKCLYVYCGSDAVRHLFRVTSSLDSMVMGEPQILGQMKEAYRDCVEQKASGIILNKLLHHAFRAAKRVRTETAIANNAVSVSFAAVEMAKKVLGNLDGRTVLLVGAGEMSELAARHLMANGAGKIIVANRTYARAVQVAEEFQGIPVGLDLLEEKLQEADIVISSTGAAGYMITPAMIQAALRRRKNRLLFLIDIAVPRDVDPEVGRIDNVYLFNIDDLQGVVDENLRNRLREAEKAEVIIGGGGPEIRRVVQHPRGGPHHRVAAGKGGVHHEGRDGKIGLVAEEPRRGGPEEHRDPDLADHQQDPPRPRHGAQGGEPVERGHALRGGHPQALPARDGGAVMPGDRKRFF